MIKNFKYKETALIWQGNRSNRLSNGIQQITRRKLRILNNAKKLADLRIPPNNRLEALKGDRKGQYSIRINQQWRIYFTWHNSANRVAAIIDH